MSSESRRNFENDSTIPTCFGKPRACFVHSFALTISTLIFVMSMILTVYLTHKASMDKIVTVLIVASSLLYILGFASYMYHIYYSKSNSVISRSDGNSNDLNQATMISARNSTSGRNTEMLSSLPPRQPIRNTPPPPYEFQMSEMSRMLLNTSRTTSPTTRESEITEEALRLIRRMHGEIRRTDQQVGQSPRNEQSVPQLGRSPKNEQSMHKVGQPTRNEQSVQQMVYSPEESTRLQGTIVPKVSHPNLVINLHDTNVKSIPSHGPKTSDFSKNRGTQLHPLPNSLPNKLDSQRMIIGSERCIAAPPQPSPRRKDFSQERILPKVSHPNLVVTLQETAVKSVAFHEPVHSDFRANQATQQQVILHTLPNQLDSQRLIIGSEVCTTDAPPLLSPLREDLLQVARKRKLTSISKDLQTRPKTIEQLSDGVVNDSDRQNNTYESIAAVENLQSGNSSQVVYDSAVVRSLPSGNSSQVMHDSTVVRNLPSNSSQLVYDSAVVRNLPSGDSSQAVYGSEYCGNESELEDSSEKSSVCSATSDTGTVDRKRNLRNQNAKLRRQLSVPSTRKFRQLGQSPETVLDAIATCYDLTPDEWMVAWKLGQKGVSPTERARILGVRLHENLSGDDNLRPDQTYKD